MQKQKLVARRPATVAVTYAAFSWVWVFSTDSLIHRIGLSPRSLALVSIGKGATYLSFTALVIYVLLHRLTLQLAEARRLRDEQSESEQRFRLLADTAPVLVWMSGTDAKCDYFNRAWLEFTGRSFEQEVGDGWAEGVHPEDFAHCLDTYVNAFHARRAFTMEYRLRRYDGEYRWILDNGIPRFTDTGVFAGYIGSCVDISAQKQAGEALASANAELGQKVALAVSEIRKGEERYRRIVETADEGIWELDAEDRITFVNAKLAAMLGFPEQEMLGTYPFVYCAPEWQAIAVAKLEESRLGARGQYELRLRGKDGTTVWGIVSATAIVKDGQYRGLIALVTDITTRKQTEEQIQKYATELAALIENAPYGIAKSTAEGRFLLVNPALVQMTGYGSTEELLRMSVPALYRNRADRERLLNEVSSHSPIHGLELEWVKKNGSPIKLRMSGVRLPNGELQMIMEDVTDARLLEEQLHQAMKMEAVGRLAGGIAHDFNNLLMVITSNLELALDGMATSEQNRKRVMDVLHASQRAAKLTSHLLAFSRKQVLQPSRINLNETIEQLARLIERVIGEDIYVRVECSPNLGTVQVDRVQLEQVVMNLAVNARDAMPNGGSLLIETANVIFDKPYLEQHPFVPAGEYVMLAVSDTGIGMDAETRGQIFEPFFTTKEAGKGTGLGLSTVYGIVKQSGGHIGVYSEPGHGTTFKIYLPRVDGTCEAEAQQESAASIHPGHGSILVVEDEELIREALTLQLSNSGYGVLHAGTVKEALQLAELHRNRLVAVLTDVVLPDSNGKALGEAIARVAPGLPVIHMSGYTPNVVVHHGILDTGTHFLQKPFTKNQLLQTLSNVLANSAQS